MKFIMMVENERLGNKIRKLRISKGMNLTTLSKKIGKTPSYLSQVERGMAFPSITALREISKALNVPVFYLLIDDDGRHSAIIRKNERKVFQFPKSHLTYELLSPDMSHQIEVIRTRIEPGATTSSKPLSHKGEECTLVMEGKMKIQVGDKFFTLEEGDSIYYIASIPHKWKQRSYHYLRNYSYQFLIYREFSTCKDEDESNFLASRDNDSLYRYAPCP